MWTISGFPAYRMLSRRSIADMLACPYCLEFTKAFTFEKGKKQSWFDWHHKFLDPMHLFRNNKNAFKKDLEKHSPAPPIRTKDHIWYPIRDFPKITEIGEIELGKQNGRGIRQNSAK